MAAWVNWETILVGDLLLIRECNIGMEKIMGLNSVEESVRKFDRENDESGVISNQLTGFSCVSAIVKCFDY